MDKKVGEKQDKAGMGYLACHSCMHVTLLVSQLC
jgi:hypothetical protein